MHSSDAKRRYEIEAGNGPRDTVNEFLKSNPNAIVLNLGCGLNTRISRINPLISVDWFDVDYPEVIEERRKFFSDGEGYSMVESSIIESKWLEEIHGDRPVIAIADGVLEYLTEDDVKTLLNRVSDHFPRGQIIFDVMSSYAIKTGRNRLKETMDAEHKWAEDDVRKVDELDPKLKRITNMSVFASRYMTNLSLGSRLIYGIALIIPLYKNMVHLLRYEF